MKRGPKFLLILGLISLVLLGLVTGCSDEREEPKESVGAITITAQVGGMDVDGPVDNGATVVVTLSTETADVEIWYTTDGSTPTAESIKYTDPFEVKANDVDGETVVIKAIGLKPGYNDSAVASGSIIFQGAEVAEIEVELEEVIIADSNEIVICIYQKADDEYPPIQGLVAEDFILIKDFARPGQTIIEEFILAPSVGTNEYALTLPGGELFDPGSYRLGFSKAGYSSAHIDFEIEDLVATDADIATAKANVESATYTAAQIDAEDASAAKTKVEALVDALELKGTSVEIVAGEFTPAVAGTAEKIDGTNGSFKFTVKINKGGGTEVETKELTLTITATAYVLSTNASISSVSVDGKTASLDENSGEYRVFLPYGTKLNDLTTTDVVVTATDTKAKVGAAVTSDDGATWTVVVTAEDTSVTQSYTINVSVEELITEVKISVAVPVAGEIPDREGSLPDDVNYAKSGTGISWKINNTQIWLQPNDTFEAGKSYDFDYRLSPDEGYMFSDTATATVNNENARLSQDGIVEGQYIVSYTFSVPADVATVTSETYAVSEGKTANETITGVSHGTSKTDFLAALIKGDAKQTWDETDLSDPVVSNDTFVVTAEDGTTTVTYTITVDLPAQSGAPAFTGGTPATFGTELTVGTGNLGTQTNLTYTWYRSSDDKYDDEVDTELSTETTYTPVADDIGNYLIVIATTTDATGTGVLVTDVIVAKAAGPAAISENYAGTFPVEATSINLTGLAASATGLEAAVAIDGSTYSAYVDLIIDGDGKATIADLAGVTTSTKVKVRVKETTTHLAGIDKKITVTEE